MPRTVDGEEAQTDYLQVEQTGIGVGHHLARQLGGRIGRERPHFHLLFGKRHTAGGTINRTGGTEDEPTHAELAAEFQHVQGALYVYLFVEMRLLD